MSEPYGKSRPFRLHFGIPTIDELIGPCDPHPEIEELSESVRELGERHRFARFGLNLPRRPKRDREWKIQKGEKAKAPIASSVNIIGADGSGKSILALHMASAYMLDLVLNRQTGAKIIYASSDLGWERAHDTWETFGLSRPLTRDIPFEIPGWSEKPTSLAQIAEMLGVAEVPDYKVALKEVQPRHKDFHRALVDPADLAKPRVQFLDLASTTAGDDWGLINRVLGCLEPIDPITADGEYRWPHMLVIDAVEGLETIVGDVDAYGLHSSRRSRIAQLMQLAAGKCHIVLINELRHDRDRLDEEFVTDLVVKLKMREKEGYSHRSIEVVKARSQPIIRGEHALTIRGTEVGRTHEDLWPDVPKTSNAYVHCFHAIDARDRILSREQSDEERPVEDAFFGIAYLDDMLGSRERSGVRRGRLTAILGDEATHKAKLVRSFAANAFTEKSTRRLAQVSDWEFVIYLTSGTWTKRMLRKRLLSHIQVDAGEIGSLTYPEAIERRLKSDPAQVDADAHRLHRAIEEHLIVRRLEISTITSNVLAHIVEELVDTAKRVHAEMHPLNESPPKLRFVIDDLATIRAIHHVLETDRKLLPYLVRFLQMEDVTTLIADTSPGRPLVAAGGRERHALQGLADRVVYTWNVPFFNENRVAITTLSPVDEDSELVVRELKLVRDDGMKAGLLERVEVDPHFELYSDIDVAEPRLVPLQVMLRIQGEASNRYIEETERSLDFNFLRPDNKPSVLHLAVSQYDELKAMASGRASYRLDQTTVLQVDEFWAHARSAGLYDLQSYLTEDTRTVLADPTGSFERRDDGSEGYVQRRQFFNDTYGSLAAHPPTRPLLSGGPSVESVFATSDRTKVVPYYWDLGFMLLNRHLWSSAPDQFHKIAERTAGRQDVRGEEEHSEAVYKAEYVKRVREELTTSLDSERLGETPSWRSFLRASQFVANSSISSESHETLVPFDIEMASPESFSSLVLEMWASEIATTEREQGSAKGDTFALLSTKASAQDENLPKLASWLVDRRFELYLVWLQLVEVLDASQFRERDSAFEFANRPARDNAVSIRHWYSSAAEFMRDKRGDQYQIARLPGYFTTRGDWFLGVARSSRSRRLGQKAIDQLTTRRANLTRLQQGVGLPVRHIVKGGVLRDPAAAPGFLRTAIPHQSVNGNELMRLDDFIDRTCPIPMESDLGSCREDFGWLWRSNLVGYHHDSRIFSRWLFSTLSWMTQIKHKRSSDWRNGFRTYDRLRLYYDVCNREFLKQSGGELPAEPPRDVWTTRVTGRLLRQWHDLQDPELHRSSESAASSRNTRTPSTGNPTGDLTVTKLTEILELKAKPSSEDVARHYDEMRVHEKEVVNEVVALDSFREFSERCDYLVRLLGSARPHHEDDV